METRTAASGFVKFAIHSLREALGLDDAAFVGAAGDEFVVVVGFELEGDEGAVDVVDASAANDFPSGRRGGEVLDFDGDTDGAFSDVKERQECLAGRLFQKPDEGRRAENLRHAVVGEVDEVFFGDDEAFFAGGSRADGDFHGVAFGLGRV